MEQSSATPTINTDVHRLTALDRCDSCGAQAYVRVELASGELLFCAHHAAQHREKLEPVALLWYDETDRLASPSHSK